MVVGAALLELRVHASRSLKQKRGVLQSIKKRVRNRFNVAVAEVGGQDTWQRAQIALSTTGSRASIVRSELRRAAAFIEDLALAEVIATEYEILEMPHESVTSLDEDAEELEDFGFGAAERDEDEES